MVSFPQPYLTVKDVLTANCTECGKTKISGEEKGIQTETCMPLKTAEPQTDPSIEEYVEGIL